MNPTLKLFDIRQDFFYDKDNQLILDLKIHKFLCIYSETKIYNVLENDKGSGMCC